MSFLAWIVLGLIAGFIGSKIVNRRGEGIVLDIVLGIVGAVAGGWLAGFFGLAGVSGLNLLQLRYCDRRLGRRTGPLPRDSQSRMNPVAYGSTARRHFGPTFTGGRSSAARSNCRQRGFRP
jgi:uncharacterized membrane protein YeaQ/YmgE (transglycosylase-associated protein family)